LGRSSLFYEAFVAIFPFLLALAVSEYLRIKGNIFSFGEIYPFLFIFLLVVFYISPIQEFMRYTFKTQVLSKIYKQRDIDRNATIYIDPKFYH